MVYVALLIAIIALIVAFQALSKASGGGPPPNGLRGILREWITDRTGNPQPNHRALKDWQSNVASSLNEIENYLKTHQGQSPLGTFVHGGNEQNFLWVLKDPGPKNGDPPDAPGL
jgi:hypothetical protein